jgi:hypothetical protein
MKQILKRSAVAIYSLSKSRPSEFRWSIYGVGVGTLAGVFFGGVGIAALGTAVGVPASLIFATVGGIIGNRVGVEKDNNAADRP